MELMSNKFSRGLISVLVPKPNQHQYSKETAQSLKVYMPSDLEYLDKFDGDNYTCLSCMFTFLFCPDGYYY